MRFQKPREIAFRVLQLRDLRNEFTEPLLQEAFERSNLDSRDRRFVQEMVFGIVRNMRTIDWFIREYSGGKDMPSEAKILIRMGIYQLLWMDKVPDHAAINESVDLTRKYGVGDKSGFINGILREIQRERNHLYKDIENLKKDDPPVGYSHPAWLIRHWSKLLGERDLARFLEWNNQAPRTYARVNTAVTNAEELEKRWTDEKVLFKRYEAAWAKSFDLYSIKASRAFPELGSFQDGDFYIQDPSTLAAVSLLNPAPTDSVLDLCSAPGGKTTALAAMMNGEGQVVAADGSPDRLDLVRENIARMRIKNVVIAENISAAFSKYRTRKFDKILIDAPCSNTGVMQRRVDLRWRISKAEVDALQDTQLSLLRQITTRIKPGGMVAYSTCSIEPGENEGVVENFIKEFPDFKKMEELRLTPWKDSIDGAYVALLTFEPS